MKRVLVYNEEGLDMSDYNFNKELNEAIRAGETALFSLKAAKKQLNSASNWGLLDLFGGGNVSGLIKHMKVNNANNCLYRAKADLTSFRRELSDIDTYIPDLEVGAFLTFADFFFDGLLADIIVQSKIKDMKRQVEDAINKTEQLLARLKGYR